MAKPGYMLIQGDANSIPLADKSVHCVVTSPPYLGLRDYGVKGQFGLEDTPEEYVKSIIKAFREVYRVLRDDGTLWLNIGDSYNNAGSSRNGEGLDGNRRGGATGSDGKLGYKQRDTRRAWRELGIKHKDLVGIPWMVAFALRSDGWYLRQDNIWSKTNPMPESVRDRCTKAHEYVFLLTKSPRYFYDNEAIKEPAVTSRKDILRAKITGRGKQPCGTAVLGSPNRDQSGGFPQADPDNPTRNARSVWEISSQAYRGAHFACMPPKLAAKLIMAGSSEHGACSECGAPYKRNITKTKLYRERPNSLTKRTGEDGTGNYCPNDVAGVKTETTGWKPSCKCDAGVVPSIVFDPFGGSGTTVAEANRLGRSGIMMDLNADYLKLAEDRIKKARIKAGLDVDAERYPLIAEIERRREAS